MTLVVGVIVECSKATLMMMIKNDYRMFKSIFFAQTVVLNLLFLLLHLTVAVIDAASWVSLHNQVSIAKSQQS